MANREQKELEKLRQGLGKQLRQRNTCPTAWGTSSDSQHLHGSWAMVHAGAPTLGRWRWQAPYSSLLASLTEFRSSRLSETLPKTNGDVGCRPLACTQVCSCFPAMNSVAPSLPQRLRGGQPASESSYVCALILCLSCLKGEQVVAKAVSCLQGPRSSCDGRGPFP